MDRDGYGKESADAMCRCRNHALRYRAVSNFTPYSQHPRHGKRSIIIQIITKLISGNLLIPDPQTSMHEAEINLESGMAPSLLQARK